MSYTTLSGDTWDKIAYKTMGSGYYMDLLIAANQRYCDIFIFESGTELEIPDVPSSSTANLPPWFSSSEESST